MRNVHIFRLKLSFIIIEGLAVPAYLFFSIYFRMQGIPGPDILFCLLAAWLKIALLY